MYVPLLLALFFQFFSFPEHGSPQDIQVVSCDALQQRIVNNCDTTFVVNFFASWCAPCIGELPDLARFAENRKNAGTVVIFVSLDLKNSYRKALPPLMETYHINGNVYVLDEPDADSWINRVDSSWSGSIPATLVVNNGRRKRAFVEGSLTYQELEEIAR